MGLIPTSVGRFHLELGGKPCGFVDSVEGGGVVAEVVTDDPGAEHYLKKHLGAAAPEPIVLTFGLALAPGVYGWLADAWNGEEVPRDGRIVFVDATLKATRQIEFRGAVVTSVTFPKLDGSSKDACRLTVVLDPEETARSRKPRELEVTDRDQGEAVVRVQLPRGGRRPRRQEREQRWTRSRSRRVPGSTHRLSRPARSRSPSRAPRPGAPWHEEFVVEGMSDRRPRRRSGASSSSIRPCRR